MTHFSHIRIWEDVTFDNLIDNPLDLFLFIAILVIIILIIVMCCSLMCSTRPTVKTPVIKEVTEVITTPISLSAYEYTNGSCTPVLCPYNDMYQQTQMGTPISPGLVDVKDSGNNHINIVLNVGSKDRVEEIPSENQHGKIEEITTSSTLNTLSSKLNKNDLKNTSLRQDKKNSEEKKSLDIKKHEAISSVNDPTTVRYTTSGEPLSKVSSKNTSNMKK